MLKTKPSRPITRAACALLLLLLALLAGCAIQTQLQDVGAVVVAPKVQLSPVPEVVRTTLPKAPGFYQKNLLDFFSVKQPAQMK